MRSRPAREQGDAVTVRDQGPGGGSADARGGSRYDRRAGGAGVGAHDATSDARWDSEPGDNRSNAALYRVRSESSRLAGSVPK